MLLKRQKKNDLQRNHTPWRDVYPWQVVLLSLALVGHASAQVDTTISQQESQSVVLPCPVNVDKCGKLHSLNWFKGDDRIAAMLLGDSNVTSVNKEFEKRVTVEQNPYRLVIRDLKIDDEDIYLCDTTFFIPEETCDNFNGYRIELRVLVPPTEVVILDAKGDRIENGSVLGPMQERQSLKATCTVKNTRPQPEVGWFRGTKRLTTYSPTHDLNGGLYTSTLELDWQLSREDLAQDIECRVKSAAIPNTTVVLFSLDLQVRPTSIDINGVQHHTVQGSKVVLTCDIHGARPAVNLTWYNSTSLISADENDQTEIRIKALEKDDGTYHTQSELIFNATRFENDRVFRCEAENVVLQINREKPISSALTLEVLYPPVVKVSPSDIVANTSEIVLLNCEYVANPASLTQVDWYRNDNLVNVNDTDHYKGGNSENVALIIKSTDKDDIGNYSCQLSNTIGKGISDQKIYLDVQYVPTVEILMIPEGPVKESDESNVTLFCNILDANPQVLTKVRWYANSTLLKELPDCEETREDLCHIDPSKLLLESIGRGFFYNYSCEGFNSAGWGPRSEDKELMVHYEPGSAELTHFPLVAVKKKSVTFSCSVEDPGYPDSNRFVTDQGNQNHKTKKTQHARFINFHSVQALQPQEADLAFEALLLHKHREHLQSSAPSKISSRNLDPEIKETHALIDLHINHSLCTLLTLTTYMPQTQILTLYTGEQLKTDSYASASSYALYRKLGKFSFVAQIVSKPNRFRWLRGGRGPLQDIVTKDWTVEPVGLDSRTNYSCYAYNEGGKGEMATINLEVHAPPFFIKNLPPYTGILHTSTNATLTCRIECVPRCDISWLKDGETIDKNDTRYFIKEKYMEASPATGDFESMLSVLHFNMQNWPLGKFDIEVDNANYTCVSSGNTVGPSIRSRTYFGIEYAPENTTVSENTVYVQEDTIPGRVICKSRANPEPSYKWIFKNETTANGNALIINTAMKRSDDGTYTCLAYNKHGSSKAQTIIIVQFKPRCEIERRQIDDQDTLICTAYGNPIEADFSWSIKAENETVEILGSGDKKSFSEKSFYVLQTDYAISRTYRCVANNTVGSGSFCEIEVAEQLAWWQLWEKTTLIILVAAILGLLLTVIIICCIIICICRRRRRQDKYLTEVSLSAHQRVLPDQPKLTQAGETQSNQEKCENFLAKQTSKYFNGHAPKSPPRWPIRPGVMLHVSSNTKENLTINRRALNSDLSGNARNISQPSNQMESHVNSDSTIVTELSVTSKKKATSDLYKVATPQLKVSKSPAIQVKGSEAQIGPSNNLPDPVPSTTSGSHKTDNILVWLFKRAKKPSQDCTRESQRGLLKTFWRGVKTNESTSEFGTEHRLKGIRCSGSVTYKKTKESIRTTANAEATEKSSPTNKPIDCQTKFSVAFQKPLLEKEAGSKNNIISAEEEDTIHLEADPCFVGKRSSIPCQNMEYISSTQPPPPTLLLRRDNNKISGCSPGNSSSVISVNDKSSSLGEPLTEPGEYENLPFHGLQTAPNKFSTTLTNFNNNTNGVPVAPRPKRLYGNATQKSANQQIDRQTFQGSQSYQQQHICDQELQQPHKPQYNAAYRPQTTGQHHQNLASPDSGRQIHHDLSSCFPKSYTEYYKQHQRQHEIEIELPAGPTPKLDSNALTSAQMLNAVEADSLPTYAVIGRPPHISRSTLLNTNPFLTANNFKKYGTTVEESLRSMPRVKHSNGALDMEKKFYSLKFSGGDNLPNQSHFINSSISSTASPTLFANELNSLSKCKRHNSIAGHCHSDIKHNAHQVRLNDPPSYNLMVVEGKADQSSQLNTGDSSLNFNQNPAIQVHLRPGEDIKKKHQHRHHNFYHQPHMNERTASEFQLIEPERISIYRSDSGISNSSYESQFPIALPQNRSLKEKKETVDTLNSGPIPKKNNHKNNEIQKKISESGAALLIDQTSLTSCTPPVAGSAASPHCNRQCNNNDKTTQEDYEQYQLGHQYTNSVSTVLSSVSTSSKSKFTSMVPGHSLSVSSPNEKNQSLPINPFLAKTGNNIRIVADNNKEKLLRRSTSLSIEHLQRHEYESLTDNCDVSRESQGYRSEDVKANSAGSKPFSGDSQTSPAEQSQIINNAKKIRNRELSANREHNKRLLVSHELLAKTSRIGSLTDIDILTSVVPSNVLDDSTAEGAYDCLVVRRPIRLPLRKHHTFHFQSTQTAKGKLQQLRERLQLQRHEREKFNREKFSTAFCPLEFSEQHAFKPISPTPRITTFMGQKSTDQNQTAILSSQSKWMTEDDEDLGYSFCEEECLVDNANYPTSDNPNTALGNSSSSSNAIEIANADALRTFVSQSCCEVHI